MTALIHFPAVRWRGAQWHARDSVGTLSRNLLLAGFQTIRGPEASPRGARQGARVLAEDTETA